MLTIESHSASAVRFSASRFDASNRHAHIPSSAKFFIPRDKVRRRGGSLKGGIGIKASAKEQQPSSGSGPKPNAKPQRYHPFEEIADSDLLVGGDATLANAEIARTIIEVNGKATLMFTGIINEDVHENIFWPDLPYVTDEHGNIYFQVKNDEDVLQALTTEETIVQAVIGLDTAEMLSEIEAMSNSEIDFGVDELDDEDGDFDDEDDDEDLDDDDDEDEDFENDWVSVVDEDDQDEDSDGSLGDWAKLETMRSSHPMYFAKKISEVVSDDPVDYMEQPSAGLAIQGLLRPAFIEEQSVIQRYNSGPDSNDLDNNDNHTAEEPLEEAAVRVNGHKNEKAAEDKPTWAEELEKDQTIGSGFSFYKLEMMDIQIVSANGPQNYVELDDYRRAKPDAIAHSAAKIISRLKAGGEKIMQALKSLCWRCKGIQVEECAIIGVDSLGFDLRVCSGTQLQTLRFAFKKRASSEYSAERQLNDLLFPRAHKFHHKKEATPQTES